MNMGGICIGCTMPGFPDKFSPFYAAPPGSFISGTTSRAVGGFIRRVRRLTMNDKQRSTRWTGDELPSGWARYKNQPVGAEKTVHRFYSKVQHFNDGADR